MISVAVASGLAYYVLNNQLGEHPKLVHHVTSATVRTAYTTSSKQAQSSATGVSAVQTATVKGEKIIGVTDLTNPQRLLSTFRAMTVSLYMRRSNTTNTVTFSYRVSEGGVTANVSTYKVRISILAEGKNVSAFLWVTEDFKNVVKIEMPDGRVLTGANAALYGRMLLTRLNQYMLASGDLGRLKIYVFPNGTLKTSLPGWKVVSVRKAQLSIDGRSYPGYRAFFEQPSSNSSKTSTLEVGIVKIRNNLWYFSYIKLVLARGIALIKVEHLEPSGA